MIGKEVGLPDNINSLLSSFGWLIFLLAMMKEEDIGKLEIVPDILSVLIVELYVNCLQLVDQRFVEDKICTSFPSSALTP